MKILLLFIILVLSINISYAQDESDSISKEVIVTTTDNRERVGVILSDDGREVLLLTKSMGKIYIPKNQIVSIRPVGETDIEEYDGDFRSTGPFTTRYYFTTNALPIKKSEDYAMIHLYGPEVHFSLTNRFSIGIMTTWIASPFVLALKYTIPTKNESLNFGLGTLLGNSGYLNNLRGYGGLHWGMMTIGNRMRNITFSGGFGYIDPGNRSGLSDLGQAPVFGIGGITKVGRKASIIFDSMLFFPIDSDVDALLYLMPGMRFQNSERAAFQFALAGVTYMDSDGIQSFPIPMCSWFFKF